MTRAQVDAANRAEFSVQAIALILKALGDRNQRLTPEFLTGWASAWRRRTRRSTELFKRPVSEVRHEPANLLAAAAASVMLPGAVNAAVVQLHPDADLIAACSEYLLIQREFEAYYDTCRATLSRMIRHNVTTPPASRSTSWPCWARSLARCGMSAWLLVTRTSQRPGSGGSGIWLTGLGWRPARQLVRNRKVVHDSSRRAPAAQRLQADGRGSGRAALVS